MKYTLKIILIAAITIMINLALIAGGYAALYLTSSGVDTLFPQSEWVTTPLIAGIVIVMTTILLFLNIKIIDKCFEIFMKEKRIKISKKTIKNKMLGALMVAIAMLIMFLSFVVFEISFAKASELATTTLSSVGFVTVFAAIVFCLYFTIYGLVTTGISLIRKEEKGQ